MLELKKNESSFFKWKWRLFKVHNTLINTQLLSYLKHISNPTAKANTYVYQVDTKEGHSLTKAQ